MDASAWYDVRDVLQDLDFPASKDEIVGHAESRGGSPAAVRLLRALPVTTYRNMSEIRSSVPLDPAVVEGQSDDLKARQSRSRHSERIAEHLRDPED